MPSVKQTERRESEAGGTLCLNRESILTAIPFDKLYLKSYNVIHEDCNGFGLPC